jgi:hypothetical protein
MDLAKFVEETRGTYVNFDTVHGPQCMDLFREYVEKVLGFDQTRKVSIAYQVWFYHQADLYERVKRTKDNFPLPGDIVIWFWIYGGTGHIAVALEGCTKEKLIVLTQNDPGGSEVGEREYSYNHVVGWLHPVGKPKQVIEL